MVSDMVRYYDDFLTDREWLAEGLSWAVVQPASAEATIDGVIKRLRARRVEPGDNHTGEFADLAQVGRNVVVFQDAGCALGQPDVLRWLSDGVRVHGRLDHQRQRRRHLRGVRQGARLDGHERSRPPTRR
ncbi:hypothetical protein [Micromonospora sp. NPDC050495]|uniref:hypothetical protein n=1 Tax=Micromonospora sp. NPDC050495 TaxID=3154936 RepID=UPI0033C376FC